MFEELAAEIEGVDIHPDADELIAGRRLLDRLVAKVAAAEVEFDRAKLWELTGQSSMTRWLVDETGMSDAVAARHTRLLRHLTALPVTASQFQAGQLTAGQVELIGTWVKPRLLDAFARDEADVIAGLVGVDIETTTARLAEWVEQADADGTPPDLFERSELHLNKVLDDYGKLDAKLTLDGTALAAEALRLARRPDDDGETRTRAQRDADAFLDICRRIIRDEDTPSDTPGRQRPGINIVIDAPDHAALELRALGIGTVADLDAFLDQAPTTAAMRAWYQAGLDRLRHPKAGTARTLTGHDLSPALAAAFTCDATLRALITAGGEILSFTKARPTLPRAIRDAVTIRDRHCRFKGCRRPPDWCEVHHLHQRQHGGPDSPTNCALFCAYHHHVLHRDGWTAHLAPDGTLTVTRPDGHTWTTRPPGPNNHPPPDPLTLGA